MGDNNQHIKGAKMKKKHGGPRPGSGRPAIDPKDRKAVKMYFRVTEAERDRIVENYKAQDFKSFGKYIRRLLKLNIKLDKPGKGDKCQS